MRLPPVDLPVGDARPLGAVLITVDTLRADYLSSYGHSRILTPSFDRLAAGGQLFLRTVAQSTTTTPSHASIMTSLYPQDHSVYSNFEALGKEPKTLAEALVGRGYETFALVNMRHLNPEVGGLGQGFQTFVKSGFMRRAGTSTKIFLDWLDGIGERPFFAWLHLADVHTPYQPPPPYNHFYYDDDERDPTKRSLKRIWGLLPTHMSDHPFFKSWLDGITDLAWVMAQYQGAVTYVDDEIGLLLDALEERSLLHRTAVVMTSDHGESLGEHDLYFVHSGLYEATVHVPLVTYFPGAARQGVEIRDVVEMVDIMPTLLDYLDVPSPPKIRGRSLWPLIDGEIRPPRVALSEHAGGNLVSLRSDRFKYIRHLKTKHLLPAYPFIRGKEELYDLKSDPHERLDVARKMPDVLRVFRRELSLRSKAKLALRAGRAKLNSETVEVLRALGYVR